MGSVHPVAHSSKVNEMTSVLSWEKPKQVMSKDVWAEFSADGAPPGSFVSNMSPEDNLKWKARLVGQMTGFPQVEIRRDSTVVVVSLKGYKYKQYNLRQSQENLDKARKWDREQDVANWPTIHIASAGATMLTLEQFNEFKQAIDEAFQFLHELVQKDQTE